MVCFQEQQEKLKQLYTVYEQPMYRIAYAILHQAEQAEDAVSDAFLKIIQNLNHIGDPDSLQTKQYIIQIIRNTSINQYRKNAKDAVRLTELNDAALQIPNTSNEVEQFLYRTEQQEYMMRLLKGLSEIDRKIIIMRCDWELSFREIAQQLSMKEETVRKRFERARKAIRKKEERGICDAEKQIVY